MHAVTAGVLVNTLSGVLMLALGVFVLSVRSGGRGNRAFAVFAIAFGATWIVNNLLVEADHWVGWGQLLTGAGLISAAAGLVFLAGAHPVSWREHPRSSRLLAVVVTVLVCIAMVAFYSFYRRGDFMGVGSFSIVAGFVVFQSVAWGVLFLFASSHSGVAARDPGSARLLVLMSAALVLYPSYFVGSLWVGTALRGELQGMGWYGLSALVVLLGGYILVWAWSLWRTGSPGGARWLPLFAVAMAFAGMLLVQVTFNNPGFGISRTLMVVVLAYAIVKHQLLGIDVRIRWGVSKGVLAGVFVAMFFVVSELTAWFFEDQVGDIGNVDPTVVGIGAAGLLLFAISPLHQLADRIAARAVPVSSGAADEGRTAYREAVLLAFSDGRIDRRDEHSLAKLAKVIGIDPEDALAVREEVEAQDQADAGG